MANGIRVSALRRRIVAEGIVLPTAALIEAYGRSPLARLRLTAARDGEWVALPKAVWDDLLQHLGAYRHRYGADLKLAGDLPGVRTDCDDYMDYAKGRAGLELSVNGLGKVLDACGHAYLAALCRRGAGAVLRPLEPQAAPLVCWKIPTDPRFAHAFRMEAGELRF